MSKISIVNAERAPQRLHVPGITLGDGTIHALFDRAADPLHAYVIALASGGSAAFERMAVDRSTYVWHGSVRSGDVELDRGSSITVERGAAVRLVAGPNGATIVNFQAARATAQERGGGHVHRLPVDDVPRYRQDSGLQGGLHADGGCATCSAWLHENAYPPMAILSPEQEEAGIHSHSENEILFVASGQMRLGRKLLGPGSAVAIAADAMYSFTSGPDGLHFLNFRAEQPTRIRFKNGHSMDEVGYWRERVPALVYA